MAYKQMDVPQFEFIGEHKVIKPAYKEGGWATEFNKVSWNNKKAKYDIRQWSPDHTKMGKGVTLTARECINLRDALTAIDLETEAEQDEAASNSSNEESVD